jgi:response regulator NasT
MDAMRVLICEDEGLTALRYRSTLRRLGFEVVGSAADGEQAIEASVRLAPDAVLMDIEMPQLNGIEATRRIMETRPTAIVIVSAYNERDMVQAAIAAGASGYLVKPVSDEQLGPALRTALDQFANRFGQEPGRALAEPAAP